MLRTTHTTTVTEDQIDHLGHMNVRYYAQNAQRASRRFLEGLPGWAGSRPELFDVYTRHHREQLLGSSLEVRSGVLGVDAESLTLHHELANVETGDLAATFIHRLRPTDDSGTRLTLPDETIATAAEQLIEPPAHAAPRSIVPDHDLAAGSPTLAELQERGLAMRLPRVVGDDECDAEDRVPADLAPMLIWGGEPVESSDMDLTHETDDGLVLAWASMESRLRLVAPARRGMRIQAHSAVIDVHDKVIHGLQWAHDLDSGKLLVAFETVSLAFDIGARRPVSIPAPVRARLVAALQADLVPAARAIA